MNVFVLEDDWERLRWFERFFESRGITWHCVDTCERADEFVGPYDLVLLDHDLGGRQLESHEDCGATFARLVRDRIGDATVVVHSWNEDGARAIKAIVPAAILAPFNGKHFEGLLAVITRRRIGT
jgi:DNA-binding response OmpR family regulator